MSRSTRLAYFTVFGLVASCGVSGLFAEPSTRPAEPTTRPADPATRPADLTTSGLLPATLPALPTTRGAEPTTRPDDPATKPADAAKLAAVERFLQSQRQSRDNARQTYSGLPDAGETTLAQLIQLTEDRGNLKLEATPLAGASGVRFKVKGLPNAVFAINRSSSTIQNVFGPNGVVRTTTTSSTSVSRIDLDVKSDTEIWSTTASSNGNYLSITGRCVKGQVSLSQNLSNRANVVGGFAAAAAIQPVSLSVYEWQAVGVNGGARQTVSVNCRAKSVTELRAKFPEEFRKHALPLLLKISDLSWMVPGPADVYSAFTEIGADAQVTERLATLLPELDSDAASVREAAGAKLQELGAAGVLAALRLDPAVLSFEQKGQIGRWIAANRRRDLAPADARKDPSFLSDCLEHSDPAVRSAAKAAIEKLIGTSVQYDPSASGDALGKSADAVRKVVLEATTPATQPAENAPNADPNAVKPAPALNVAPAGLILR